MADTVDLIAFTKSQSNFVQFNDSARTSVQAYVPFHQQLDGSSVITSSNSYPVIGSVLTIPQKISPSAPITLLAAQLDSSSVGYVSGLGDFSFGTHSCKYTKDDTFSLSIDTTHLKVTENLSTFRTKSDPTSSSSMSESFSMIVDDITTSMKFRYAISVAAGPNRVFVGEKWIRIDAVVTDPITSVVTYTPYGYLTVRAVAGVFKAYHVLSNGSQLELATQSFTPSSVLSMDSFVVTSFSVGGKTLKFKVWYNISSGFDFLNSTNVATVEVDGYEMTLADSTVLTASASPLYPFISSPTSSGISLGAGSLTTTTSSGVRVIIPNEPLMRGLYAQSMTDYFMPMAYFDMYGGYVMYGLHKDAEAFLSTSVPVATGSTFQAVDISLTRGYMAFTCPGFVVEGVNATSKSVHATQGQIYVGGIYSSDRMADSLATDSWKDPSSGFKYAFANVPIQTRLSTVVPQDAMALITGINISKPLSSSTTGDDSSDNVFNPVVTSDNVVEFFKHFASEFNQHFVSSALIPTTKKWAPTLIVNVSSQITKSGPVISFNWGTPWITVELVAASLAASKQSALTLKKVQSIIAAAGSMTMTSNVNNLLGALIALNLAIGSIDALAKVIATDPMTNRLVNLMKLVLTSPVDSDTSKNIARLSSSEESLLVKNVVTAYNQLASNFIGVSNANLPAGLAALSAAMVGLETSVSTLAVKCADAYNNAPSVNKFGIFTSTNMISLPSKSSPVYSAPPSYGYLCSTTVPFMVAIDILNPKSTTETPVLNLYPIDDMRQSLIDNYITSNENLKLVQPLINAYYTKKGTEYLSGYASEDDVTKPSKSFAVLSDADTFAHFKRDGLMYLLAKANNGENKILSRYCGPVESRIPLGPNGLPPTTTDPSPPPTTTNPPTTVTDPVLVDDDSDVPKTEQELRDEQIALLSGQNNSDILDLPNPLADIENFTDVIHTLPNIVTAGGKFSLRPAVAYPDDDSAPVEPTSPTVPVIVIDTSSHVILTQEDAPAPTDTPISMAPMVDVDLDALIDAQIKVWKMINDSAKPVVSDIMTLGSSPTPQTPFIGKSLHTTYWVTDELTPEFVNESLSSGDAVEMMFYAAYYRSFATKTVAPLGPKIPITPVDPHVAFYSVDPTSATEKPSRSTNKFVVPTLSDPFLAWSKFKNPTGLVNVGDKVDYLYYCTDDNNNIMVGASTFDPVTARPSLRAQLPQAGYYVNATLFTIEVVAKDETSKLTFAGSHRTYGPSCVVLQNADVPLFESSDFASRTFNMIGSNSTAFVDKVFTKSTFISSPAGQFQVYDEISVDGLSMTHHAWFRIDNNTCGHLSWLYKSNYDVKDGQDGVTDFATLVNPRWFSVADGSIVPVVNAWSSNFNNGANYLTHDVLDLAETKSDVPKEYRLNKMTRRVVRLTDPVLLKYSYQDFLFSDVSSSSSSSSCQESKSFGVVGYSELQPHVTASGVVEETSDSVFYLKFNPQASAYVDKPQNSANARILKTIQTMYCKLVCSSGFAVLNNYMNVGWSVDDWVKHNADTRQDRLNEVQSMSIYVQDSLNYIRENRPLSSGVMVRLRRRTTDPRKFYCEKISPVLDQREYHNDETSTQPLIESTPTDADLVYTALTNKVNEKSLAINLWKRSLRYQMKLLLDANIELRK